MSADQWLDNAIAFGVYPPGAGPGGGEATRQEVQQFAFNSVVDEGVADAYVATLTPAITGLTDRLVVILTPNFANTSNTPILTVNGFGAIIKSPQFVPLAPGDIGLGAQIPCVFIYCLAQDSFVLLNPAVSGASAASIQGAQYSRGEDTGVADAYVVNMDVNLGFYGPGFGSILSFTPLFSNATVAPTVDVGGLGATPITISNSAAMPPNAILAGIEVVLMYCRNTQGFPYWRLLNPNINGGLVTQPPVSSAPSLVIGTAFQNTLGYDVMMTVYLSITAATTANILLGVGSTNTPTQQTVVASLTTAALMIVPIPIYIPSGYYARLSTSGTITATITGQIRMPI